MARQRANHNGKEIDALDYQYDEERLLITPKRTILPGKYQDMMPWSEMGYSIVDLAEQNQWNSLHGDGTETMQVFLGAGGRCCAALGGRHDTACRIRNAGGILWL